MICSIFLPNTDINRRAAGHAAYGNLHFVMIEQMSEDASRQRYDGFMRDLVADGGG